jgi:mRNA interferase MazF
VKKGDIVLIQFPFTDLIGSKNRPALILIDSDEDVTVCFITTNFTRNNEFDIPVSPTNLNGLKKDSLIRINKLATIDKALILGRLGTLELSVIRQINVKLMNILQLNI